MRKTFVKPLFYLFIYTYLKNMLKNDEIFNSKHYLQLLLSSSVVANDPGEGGGVVVVNLAVAPPKIVQN